MNAGLGARTLSFSSLGTLDWLSLINFLKTCLLKYFHSKFKNVIVFDTVMLSIVNSVTRSI